jgi:hypothetical protein
VGEFLGPPLKLLGKGAVLAAHAAAPLKGAIGATLIPAALEDVERFTAGKQAGLTKTQLWRQTGVADVPGSKIPASEIPDYYAKVRVPKGATSGETHMGEILDHPELYHKWPELRNTPVKWEFSDSPTRGSLFDPVSGEIHIQAKDLPEMKSSLIHELTHKIQKEVGWPEGSGPDWEHFLMEAFPESYEKKLSEVGSKYGPSMQKELMDTWNAAKPEHEAIMKGHENKLSFEEMDKIPTPMKNKLADFMYRQHAGEAQAYMNEDRALMRPNTARAVPPLYDKPEGSLIYNALERVPEEHPVVQDFLAKRETDLADPLEPFSASRAADKMEAANPPGQLPLPLGSPPQPDPNRPFSLKRLLPVTTLAALLAAKGLPVEDAQQQ